MWSGLLWVAVGLAGETRIFGRTCKAQETCDPEGRTPGHKRIRNQLKRGGSRQGKILECGIGRGLGEHARRLWIRGVFLLKGQDSVGCCYSIRKENKREVLVYSNRNRS